MTRGQAAFWLVLGLVEGFISEWVQEQIGDLISGVVTLTKGEETVIALASCGYKAYESYQDSVKWVQTTDDLLLDFVFAASLSREDVTTKIESFDDLKTNILAKSCSKKPADQTADSKKIHAAVFNLACNTEVKERSFLGKLFYKNPNVEVITPVVTKDE